VKRIDDPAARERIIREGDWNLDGKPNPITPNEYWALAKEFNPTDYDPDKWCKAAKDAGFTYVVLTSKHHNGFVSPPDWYFDRERMSFLYGGARRKNPELPNLGPDLKPREVNWPTEKIEAHENAYVELVNGQVEELLTNYGKIDLLWFDGKPSVANAGERVISIERIRQLQPGIVMNPRLHGKGDFITFERRLNTDKVHDGWAEFCNTWASNWSYVEQPARANGFILGQLARSRSLGINYLLGIGPMKSGDFSERELREHGGRRGVDESERRVDPRDETFAGQRIGVGARSGEGSDSIFIRQPRVQGQRDVREGPTPAERRDADAQRRCDEGRVSQVTPRRVGAEV
jgi:alpha-L-fucosidase